MHNQKKLQKSKKPKKSKFTSYCRYQKDNALTMYFKKLIEAKKD
tara:strand:- start:190 stop:321 length:132 start_codon:yes stop_codon:yes gene_type:complete